MTIMTGLIVLSACLALAGILRSEYEKGHFVTEEVEILTDRLQGGERTYVFLTDMHNQEFGPGNRDLLAAIHGVKPDVILAGGDMMTCKGKQNIEPAVALIKALAERYPVYHGYGNHESRMDRQRSIYEDQYDRYIEVLKARGVVFLRNEAAEDAMGVHIAGLELEDRYFRKFGGVHMPEGYLEQKLGRASESGYQILLAHSPCYWREYAHWGADLTLAGHFHGGTIRIPVLGGVMTPQFQFFSPWCAGTFKKNGRWMLVGRGLGTHSIRIRINNRPQLLVIRLRQSQAGK